MTFFGITNKNHFCMISGIFLHMICEKIVAIFYIMGVWLNGTAAVSKTVILLGVRIPPHLLKMIRKE